MESLLGAYGDGELPESLLPSLACVSPSYDVEGPRVSGQSHGLGEEPQMEVVVEEEVEETGKDSNERTDKERERLIQLAHVFLPPDEAGPPNPTLEATLKKFHHLRGQGKAFNDDLLKRKNFACVLWPRDRPCSELSS